MLQLPKFGHVSTNCKQPPRRLWCGGSHVHRECSEKTNTESRPRCCNCTILEGENPHPASYRGCSHANGELQRRRAQQAPKGPSGRAFFSKFTSPQQSYAAALRQDKQHQIPQTTQTEQQYLPQKECQKIDLSVQAPSSSNNDSVATVVHQIMTKLTKAVSEEDRVMVITKLILNLMQQNGC
jgi:hypothetical protein